MMTMMKTIMIPSVRFACLLSLLQPLEVAAQAGSFFVLHGGSPLVSERIDPILAPGVIGSNHVHEIFGGNKFSANWDYATAQTSTCNNMGPKIDHSNYWYPALYFKDGDNFIKTKTDLSIYYHFDTRDNGPRKPFPDGFKMISGNAMLRHNDTLTDFSTRSIKWICHGATNGGGRSPDADGTGSVYEGPGAFPTGFDGCPGVFGLSGEIWFPFCHNGEELDPANPTAHMSFGTHTNANGDVDTSNQAGGKCPASHPTPLPQLFMEFHHDISDLPKWDANTNPWVLAPGDPTGYAMHADFINGWEKGFAEQIAVDPNDPTKTVCFTGEAGADKCFELDEGDCKIEPELNEEVQNPGASLPGCNPIQEGPDDAKIQTNCAGVKAPAKAAANAPVETGKAQVAASAPAASAADSAPSSTAAAAMTSTSASGDSELKDVTPPATSQASTESSSQANPASVAVNGDTWVYQGCYSDLVPDRSIRTLHNWGAGKTAQDCAVSCAGKGYHIAGIEYGNQCFCDDKMVQTKKLDDGKCNTSCAGGSSGQTCGGAGALQVYAKKGTSLGLTKRSHGHRHIRDFHTA